MELLHRRMDMRRTTRRGALLLVVLIATLGVACSGGDEDDGAGSAELGGGGDMALEDQAAPGRGTARRSATDVPSVGPAVIKTANLAIEVEHDGFQDAFQSVIGAAQSKGGYVLSSNAGGADSRRGSITLRVPVEAFESTVAEIADLGSVTDESESGEDVSEEFVDLQARIRHLSAQEAVMLRLMDRAESIPDSIRVHNELTRIQLDMERLRGRLRYLEDQTEFSTITVQLKEAGVVASTEPGTVERAWDVARETTGAIFTAILVGGAAIVPVAFVLLVAFLAFRWIRPRLGRLPGA